MWDIKYHIAFTLPLIAFLHRSHSLAVANPNIIKKIPITRDLFIEDVRGPRSLLEGSDSFPMYRSLKKNFTVTTQTIKVLNHTTVSKGRVSATSTSTAPLLGATPDDDVVVYQEQYCAGNAVLQNDTCVREVIYKPHMICPAGFKKHKDQCVASSAPLLTCGDGMRLQGRTCVQTVSTPPENTCLGEGEVYDAVANLCRRLVGSVTRCPAGYTLSGTGLCQMTVPPVTQCPDGYTLSVTADTCVRESLFVGSILCPNNSTYNEETNQCISSVNSPPRCASGYVYHADQRTCIALVGRVPNDCPAGYTLTAAGACQRTVETPVVLTCPTGYNLVNNVCTTLLSSAPTCQDGFEYNDGICERVVDEILTCPNDTVPVTVLGNDGTLTQCQRTVYANLTQCCETGYELVNGTCVQELLGDPQWTCEQDCYTVVTTPPLFLCPNGTEFGYLATDIDREDPICMRNTTMEICVTEYNGEVCENLTNPATNLLRRLQDDDVIDDEVDLCDSDPVCQNISRVDIFEAESYCEDGSIVTNNTCIAYEPVVPEASCAEGDLDEETGNCRTVLTLPPTSKCPDGTLQSGLTCITYDYIEPDSDCPENTELDEDGECIETTSPTLQAGQTHNVSATATCTGTDVLSGNGSSCVRALQLDLTYTCPDGAQETVDNLCVLTASTLLTAPSLTAYTPQYACPDGTTLTGSGTCTALTSVDTLLTCPDDSVPDETGTFCVKNQLPVVTSPYTLSSRPRSTCPENAKIKKGSCVSNLSTSPTTACDGDTVLGDNRCTRSTTPQLICPKGTVITDRGCTKTITSAPRLRVVQGCVATADTLTTGGNLGYTVQCFADA